jgi:ABC-type branched-subunit amino acid transport system permease subunit
MLMIMVILGGVGHLGGGVIGAAVFLLLEETLAAHTTCGACCGWPTDTPSSSAAGWSGRETQRSLPPITGLWRRYIGV